MYRNRPAGILRLTAALCCLYLLIVASPSQAQYMFMDTNGDGLSTSEDQFSQTGVTRLDIWLITDRNRDGSIAECRGGLPYSITSYEFILRVDSGHAQWGECVNLLPGFSTRFGPVSTSQEYCDGFGGMSSLPPGKYKLAQLDVFAISGTPSLTFVPTSSFFDARHTSFGSACPALGANNTVTFGTDWHDAEPLRSGTGTGNITPPTTMAARKGIMYLGGHRLTSPMTLAVTDSGLVVNGFRLSRQDPTRPRYQKSHGDTIRDALSRQARQITQAARGNGLSNEAILRLVRDNYAANSLVTSAEIVGRGISLRYSDTSMEFSWEVSPPLDPDRERTANVFSRYRLLTRLGGHLEQGGVVIYSPSGTCYLPINLAPRLDDLIQQLQTSSSAQPDAFLKRYLPAMYIDELRAPIPLTPTSQGVGQ